MEEVDFGSGPQPLATYLTGGEPLLERVETFQVSNVGVTVNLAVLVDNASNTSRASYTSSTLLHN